MDTVNRRHTVADHAVPRPTLDGEKNNNFQKDEYQNYIGSNLCNIGDELVEESFCKLGIELCPTTLSFKDSGSISLQLEEEVMLTGLKEHFQQWQMDFQPYVAYCNSHVDKQS